MEGGVEDRDVRDVGEGLPRDADRGHVGRVLQRSQVAQPLEGGQDVVVDHDRLPEHVPPWTTRWPTTAGGSASRSGPKMSNARRRPAIAEAWSQYCPGSSMRPVLAVAGHPVLQVGTGLADPLDQAAGEHLAR